MRSEFRIVGRHTAIYGTGVILSKLASFIMLPVYTHYLTTADYGILELLGTTIDVIGMIAGIGLASGVFKFYAEQDDPAAKQQVLSTVALGGPALALVTAAAGLLFAGPLSELVFRKPDYEHYFRIFFTVYFFQALGGPAMLLLQIRGQSVAFVSVSLARLIVSLALNIYFVVVRRMGLDGVLLANVLAASSFGIALAAYSLRQVGFSFSLARFRAMSRFGAPMVVVSLGSFFLTFADRYFLNYYHGAGDVGVYSLAYRFGFVLSALVVVPFQQIWEPRRFEIARRPGAQDMFSRMFFYTNVLLLGGATVIIAVIQDLLRVMVGPAFFGAYRVVPLILAVTVLQQWATYCNFGLLFREKTGHMAWASAAAVAVNLVLNFLLIPRWGMMGAAWATLGAYAVRFALTYTLSQAQYYVAYPWGRVGALVMIPLAVFAARALYAPAALEISIPFSSLLLVLSAMVAFATLTTPERRVLHNMVRRVLRIPGSDSASVAP